MDAAELADLLSQVACFAPGQSFHVEGLQAGTGGGCSSADGPSSTSSELEGSSSASGGGSKGRRVDAARLRGAMHRSLVCVAAFAEEQHLPQHQHLAARGLAEAPGASQHQQAQQQEQQHRERLSGSWPRLRRPRRVLVGFARAVGDAALVATGVPKHIRVGLAVQRCWPQSLSALAHVGAPCLSHGDALTMRSVQLPH